MVPNDRNRKMDRPAISVAAGSRLTMRFMRKDYGFGAFPEAQEEQMQEEKEFASSRPSIARLILTFAHQQAVAP